ACHPVKKYPNTPRVLLYQLFILNFCYLIKSLSNNVSIENCQGKKHN
ncbi:uncharacterized protein METZ01_LOCUS205197, partial [marine metagenome]